ncbi:MAG: hypothetical protein EKK39_14500 [Sphingobacteriales bacterium]|uniref:hypothetical protein n=1 Tax=Hydrotalea flava TaxID=714549 RepID=UPI00082D3070|nr:hypothetical protein [Hydrotalea flava]RTL47324.1 MAG: hypothetical protein EKK39_14500 [Sphingobacteriales bacterium]
MTFDYEHSFNQDKDKWRQFDQFLTELADTYPDEFEKDIYRDKTFMAIGYKSSPPDIGYAFHHQVPTVIQEQILQKLKLLFP